MTADTLSIGNEEWSRVPSTWSVFPTPGRDQFRSETATTIQVHGLDGRFWGRFDVGPDRPVRTDSWPAGVYVLSSPLGRTSWIKLP